MTLLQWNHASSVGVQILDEQHGVLIDTLNALSVGAAGGAPANEVRELIARLLEYTKRHFQTENMLMEKFEYPGYEEHKTEHERLVVQIADAGRAMQMGEPVHLRMLTGYVRQWFSAHMEGTDHELGAWLNTQGIE